ncbi:hypothetical protein LJ656_07225 [Paraburkholderia sp. MMS20-SJTR3]|uniref:Uncharacterized protein n=1 Tax=Paraburkholderia sejongensis TaxID=2886946 RepID=A0ABS8JR52_9BURK|nr:hypothetical protein [Paraburkholderia sp. MMS20-SJTR3]MCC8392376.1 hypothetical protein [Paraburkholderia sp. MMS20-SJTR3]
MKRAIAATLLAIPALCLADGKPFPPCGNWPTNMAYMQLRNVGILGDIDAEKTKTVLVANEKIGKDKDGEQLWKQVYHVTFHDRNGNVIKVITVNHSGEFECSIAGVDVFVVSQHYPSEERLIEGIDYPDKKQ